MLALSSLRAGAGLPVETEAEVSRVRRLVALQQEEDRARRLDPGQERREAQAPSSRKEGRGTHPTPAWHSLA